MNKKNITIFSFSLLVLAITYFFFGSNLHLNSSGKKYFYIAKPLHINNSEYTSQSITIVKEFNKIFGTNLNYIFYDIDKFLDDRCQLDVDTFEVGLLPPLYYTCYKIKFDTENAIPIAKQLGCKNGVYVLSSKNEKIEPTSINGKNIGTIRRQIIPIKIFLNEPVAISPASVLVTENTDFLLKQLFDHKIDYILSIGWKYGDDQHLLKITEKKQKLEELSVNDKKLYVSHLHEFDIPCAIIAGNSENPMFSTESARKDFINKLNSNIKSIMIDQFSSSDEPFVPVTRDEINKIQGYMVKGFNYTFNSKSDGEQRDGADKSNNANGKNFQPEDSENSQQNGQFQEGEKPGPGGQPIMQGEARPNNG